jgi:hypothetical protein
MPSFLLKKTTKETIKIFKTNGANEGTANKL